MAGYPPMPALPPKPPKPPGQPRQRLSYRGHALICPNCGSKCRSAAAVYQSGTRNSTRRTNGSWFSVGLGRYASPRIGVFTSRSNGTSASIAAQIAAPAQPVVWGGSATFALFVALLFILITLGVPQPFWWAFGLSIAVAIAVPVITGIQAAKANIGYENRWYCNTCGSFWNA